MARPDIADYDLKTPAGQADWNEDQYMHGAEGLPVQDDLTDRLALDDTARDEVARDELGTVNHTDVNYFGVKVKSYTGGNVVELPQHPEPMDTEVRDALDAGDIYTTGGTVGQVWADGSDNGPYWDPTWVVEASKMTGEKFF